MGQWLVHVTLIAIHQQQVVVALTTISALSGNYTTHFLLTALPLNDVCL